MRRGNRRGRPGTPVAGTVRATTTPARCSSARCLTRPAWHARPVPYHVSAEEFEALAAAALDPAPAPRRERMDADNLRITNQPGATTQDRASDIDEHVLRFYEG